MALIKNCNGEIKLSPKISINISIDDNEYEALAKIVAYLRTRTASNAVRWALVTAADVINEREREKSERIASIAALSAEQQNK